jgi:hypothetical protein
MVLRETTFIVGGALTIGLGIALAYGLFVSGAGWEFVDAWLAAGIAVGFGAFFIYVGRAEAADRRRYLKEIEEDHQIPSEGRVP